MGQTRYEFSDADPRLIAALAGGIAVFLILTPLVLTVVYPAAGTEPGRLEHLPLPPAPRLQASPAEDLAKLRAEEVRQLTTYGWVDRQAGIVRIPVERAMELTATRGIAGWDQATPDPQIPPRVPR